MKVAFLDRDGVINKETGYLYKISSFEFTYRCFEALSNIKNKGYEIIIFTNQSGIARGYYSEDDFHALMNWVKSTLTNHQISIKDIFFCPHHPNGVVKKYKKDCECRKPKPGMLLDAIKKHDIDMDSSFVVGDKISDVRAGFSAGIKNGYLVETGHPVDESHRVPIYSSLFSLSLELE